MAQPFEIVVSGHLCIDLIPQMPNVPRGALANPGKLFEVGKLDMSTGGPVSNTGLSLQQLGVRTGLMACVGGDWLGQATIDLLRQRDPALCDLITVYPDQTSSYSIVLAPGGSDRTFLHCTGTNSTFNAESVVYGLLRGVKIFHLGYPPLLPRLVENDGSELARIYRRVKAMDVITSLDMAVPDPGSATGRANWRKILQNTLPFVDVFIPSIEEILFMLRRADLDRWGGNPFPHLSLEYLHTLAGELLAMGTPVVGFKLGEYGIYLRTGDQAAVARLKLDVTKWANGAWYQPTFAVNVRTTLGAGDAAYAGFLTALLHQQGPVEALRWACATGACSAEAVDSVSGVQDLESMRNRLAAGWKTNPAVLRRD